MKWILTKTSARYAFLLLTVLTNCAITLTRDQRVISNVIDTDVSKKIAFERANLWLAKSLGNANLAVQIRDAEKGRIISNGSLNCLALNGMRYGIAERQNIDFTFDFTAKDKKVRIIFGDVTHTSRGSNGMTFNQGPISEKQLRDIDVSCFEPLRSDLLKSISGKSTVIPSDDF